MKFPVLILDDDHHWLTLYTHYLDQALYTIESTTSLEYALEQIQNFPYPVIVSDLRLIGYGSIGGFRILDEAAKNNRFTKVIITACGGMGTAVAGKAIEKGAFTYLTKPVDIKILDECIKKALLCWEREIEECISLGFLRMDYVSRLFTMAGNRTGFGSKKHAAAGVVKVCMCHAPCDDMDSQMIANILEKNGIPISAGRRGGGSLPALLAEIDKETRGPTVILVILSKEATVSGWAAGGAGAAAGRYKKNKNIRIIPVMLDDVEVPPLLAGNKILDLQTNVNEKIDELLRMIRKRGDG